MSNSLSNQPARIRRAFEMAEEFWEAEICGHKANGVGSVTISASAPFMYVYSACMHILPSTVAHTRENHSPANAAVKTRDILLCPCSDGPFNILGSAGPTRTVRKGGFVYATRGEMEFDSADLNVLADDGDLVSTIVHEMAHVSCSHRCCRLL